MLCFVLFYPKFRFNCLSYISSRYLAHQFLHSRVCSHPSLRPSPGRWDYSQWPSQDLAFLVFLGLSGSSTDSSYNSLAVTGQSPNSLITLLPSPTKADLKHFHLLVFPLAPTSAHQSSPWLAVPSTQPTSFPQASTYAGPFT